MILKNTILIALLSLALPCFSQTIYGIAAPDSVRKKCEEIIVSEIGKTAFTSNVTYIKSDLQSGVYAGGDKWRGYTVFYSFKFPNVKESHVVFSLDYKTDSKRSAVVKDGAFKNYTRLPYALKTKKQNVIDYQAAKKIVVASDTVFKNNQNNLFGELSTDYDDKLKDYRFVWYFYYIEPCKKCATAQYNTYSVYLDAVSGKIINSIKNVN